MCVFWFLVTLCGKQDLPSLTRDQRPLVLGTQSLNPWTPRKVPHDVCKILEATQ